MNRRRKMQRLKHHQIERVLTHEQLVARGRELGFPPFCGTWGDETLIRKIKETENGTV